ncbi:hypothetical protein HPB51_015901 [Rhipicephalus microplus]|uniref:S1-like domain-containing protein n=1 Tax=Rhipicephalus microplus TaxID=6941 RepID=A0A9J6DHZ7_RHIMP|nr:hypothetical protein HPB51_015901 [Rhipicephalus microplus]
MKRKRENSSSRRTVKVWINQGDIILVGLRDYQDAKADVILKYNPDEARNLKSYGELPEHAKINDTVNFGEEEEDDNIEFDEVSGDEDIEGSSPAVEMVPAHRRVGGISVQLGSEDPRGPRETSEDSGPCQ